MAFFQGNASSLQLDGSAMEIIPSLRVPANNSAWMYATIVLWNVFDVISLQGFYILILRYYGILEIFEKVSL